MLEGILNIIKNLSGLYAKRLFWWVVICAGIALAMFCGWWGIEWLIANYTMQQRLISAAIMLAIFAMFDLADDIVRFRADMVAKELEKHEQSCKLTARNESNKAWLAEELKKKDGE